MLGMKEKMMINLESLKKKKVLVVGLARSGAGAARILSELGARVTVTDIRARHSLASAISALPHSVSVVAGEHPEELFVNTDLIVTSPGVPLEMSQIKAAGRRGIPVIGELELAYQLIDMSRHDNTKSYGNLIPKFIGITGTNGKSTTATLLALMLKRSGFNTLLCGNIGKALTEVLPEQGFRSDSPRIRGIDRIVLEISSFQLESIMEFRPEYAAVLNITADHLDRYNSVDTYANAKARIWENQDKGDRLVLNADDIRLMKMFEAKRTVRGRLMPDVLFFSRSKEVRGVYLKDGIISCNMPDVTSVLPHFPIMATNDVKIRGLHNLDNAMAAALLSLLSGCRPEDVRLVLSDFPGLEHRMEMLGVFRGVTFINDSKGTNVGAVAKSIENFHNLILIMGGLDKNSDFTVLRDLIRNRVKRLILIGEAREKIARDIGSVTEMVYASDMHEAVRISVSAASEGDVVMLSPGCASFDMFRDFEDRGDSFKEAVRKVAA